MTNNIDELENVMKIMILKEFDFFCGFLYENLIDFLALSIFYSASIKIEYIFAGLVITRLLLLITFLSKHRSKFSKKTLFMYILKRILSTSLWGAFLAMKYFDIMPLPIIFVLTFQISLILVENCLESENTDIEILSRCGSSLISFLLILQHATIILKIEKYFPLDWRQTFWGYWILIGIFSCIQIIALLFLMNNFCKFINIFMKESNTQKENQIKVYWYFFSFFFTNGTSFILIFGNFLQTFSKLLDSEHPFKINVFSMILPLFWFIGSIIGVHFTKSYFSSFN